MEKSQQPKTRAKNYWSVFHKKEVLFSGTYTECWKFFVESEGNYKLKDLVEDGYRVARKS